jgi:hypothetical protein
MIFELLFIALFLTTLIALVIVLIMAVRGSRRSAMRLLRAVGGIWAVYLFIVGAVSATTTQRIVPMGQDLCFDEMCFAAVQAQSVSQLGSGDSAVKADGQFYVITVRVSSHSRGRTQSEGGLRALLWDSGKYFGVSPQGQRAWEADNGATAPLTARLRPGESVLSVQVFDVPREVSAPGLVLSHGFGPGYFVIGECSLFHKPTITRINL